MKRRFTKILAALALLVFMMPSMAGWGQELNLSSMAWSTPIVDENFNSLTAAMATEKHNPGITNYTAMGEFNCVYNNNTANSYGIENNSTLNSNALKLRAGSTSPVITAISGKSFATKGAYTFKITKTSKCYVGLFNETISGTAYTKAKATAYLQNNAGELSICNGSGWVSVGSFTSADVLEICVIYNSTDESNVTYGDGVSLAAKSAHVYVNGACVMDGTTPKSFTIPGCGVQGFRVSPTTTIGNVAIIDDLKIYDALPTAASTDPSITISGDEIQNDEVNLDWNDQDVYTADVVYNNMDTPSSDDVAVGVYSDESCETAFTGNWFIADFATNSVESIEYAFLGNNASSDTRTVYMRVETYNAEETDWVPCNVIAITQAAQPQVATPTFSPAAGAVSVGTTVTLSCATANATIVYSVNDGDLIEQTSPVQITINEDTEIEAFATASGYRDSETVTANYTLRGNAVFVNGVYTEPFDSQESFDKWSVYSVSGDETWVYNSSYGAYITGSSHNNEDWLISPKMAVENGKLHIAFDCVGRYGNQQTISALYSTDYPGYGNPNSYNWTAVTTKPAIPYAASSWTYKTIECDVNAATDVYFAFKYVSTTSSSGTFEMKPFTAKQYYPVNYFVNGGSGTMDSEYYVVGETVYVPYPYFHTEDIDDGFIAPEGMAFSTWNTQANGQGTTYDPDGDATFIMGISAVDLYAQWATAYQLTVGNPSNVDIIASCGSESIPNGGSTGVAAGKYVYLFAEPAEGYEFGNFIVTKASGGTVEVTYEYDEELQYGIYYFLMPADNVTVTATVAKITTVVDELTRETTGITGQNYGEWSGKKGNNNSTTVYAGLSAGGDNNSGDCIQLRSKNSNSGIVTTTSGGKVKKIIVTWNNQTSDNNRLDVYGKNTPYEDATNLYGTSGNSNQGAFLGSITKGTSTELTVEDDYTYLGLRSYSGALYIDKIEITWDVNYSATTNVTAHTTNTGWYFIASPFSANNSLVATDEDYLPVAMDDDATDLYYYDEPTHMWMNYKQHPNDFTFANGVGYLYANSGDVTLTFAGTSLVANESKSVDLSYTETAAPLAGWNLVGNPFNCKATITDGNGGEKSFYVVSDMNVVPNTGSKQINPCAGVMVQAAGAGESVVFTKVSENAPASQINQLEMTVAQQVMSRGTATSLVHDNAIVNFNAGSQLEKFPFNADAAELYIPQDGKDYAIISSEAQGEMPVNFKAKENGTYTLSINVEGMEMNYLHLIDNKTGNDVDLLQTPSYSFEAKTTDYESRFKLVFVANNEDSVSTGTETFAFFSNGSFVINNEGNAELQVIDITGRIVKSESINGCANVNVNAAPGVYMLRLINGDNVKTQKVVVK